METLKNPLKEMSLLDRYLFKSLYNIANGRSNISIYQIISYSLVYFIFDLDYEAITVFTLFVLLLFTQIGPIAWDLEKEFKEYRQYLRYKKIQKHKVQQR